MSTWLRVFGLRVALLSGLVAAVGSGHAATGKTELPFALLDSFDQAFACVYRAAERKVAELEATPPVRPPRDVVTILRALECDVDAACDAASTALEVELQAAGTLSPERRMAVLGCIERHLGEARRAGSRADDPEERAAYDATCERLRDIRRLI